MVSGFKPECPSGFNRNLHHSQLKGFLRRYRGISTKYLDSYLRWFHLIGMVGRASPRACLAAAISSPCIHFGN